MDPFEIDQDDKYGQLKKPEDKTGRARRLARENERKVVRRAIGKKRV